MAHLSSYDPSVDDLCLYDGTNSGQPIGWNTGSPLYPYRSQLRWLRLPYRSYDHESSSYPEPGGTSLAQKPNYWNHNHPPIVFVASKLAVCAQHFWNAGNGDGNRQAGVYNIWDAQVLKFADASFNLTTLDNATLLYPYTKQSDGTRVSLTDVGIFEYDGAISIDADDCLPVIRPETIPYGASGWYLDGNGKAIPCTFNYTHDYTPDESSSVFSLTIDRLLDSFVGDSGAVSLVLHPDEDRLYLVGHDTTGGGETHGSTSICAPSYPTSYLNTLGTGKSFTPVSWRMVIGSGYATETKCSSISAILADIASEVA